MTEAAELDKLDILLNHWIEHNNAHKEEYIKWANKAKDLGAVASGYAILEAVESVKRINELLAKAKTLRMNNVNHNDH